MPLPDIQLDDRTFEQLYAEARQRIPAYTADWTDHNESDPGSVLLQLFCWLQEMTIYRLNQVPQKNYVKFLELVGQNLAPAAAATVDLKFSLSSANLGVGIPIPAGTRVRSSAAGANGPVVFTTDSDMVAIGGDITQVQVFDGGTYTVISQDQIAAGTPFAPFSNQPQANAALLLGFAAPFPPSPVTPIRLTVYSVPADGNVIVQVSPTAADVTLPADVVWEFYSGDDQNWTELTLTKDNTFALSQPGFVEFTIPNGATAQVASQTGALQRPGDPMLYWVRCRIDSIIGPGFQSQPMLQQVQANTVSATNAQWQDAGEQLGASSGLPDQTFTLSGSPVLPDPGLDQTLGKLPVYQTNPQLISVDEGTGFAAWNETSGFAGNGPNDAVYTLDRTTGFITFGNGVNGRIPRYMTDSSGAADDETNIIAAAYRYGGGAAGNSPADTITSLLDSVPYLQSVTNPRPAVGGADAESIDDAQQRLPEALRTQSRAVTAADFADLAMLTPGAQIRRAYALPQFHPVLSVSKAPLTPGAQATDGYVPFPGVVTVFVIPYTTNNDPKPVPNVNTCNLVAAQLDGCRLITTEVYVTGPNYRQVEVDVALIADPRVPLGTVQTAVNTALLAYFNPITGGDLGTGFDFGGTVSLTDTLRQILIIPGVLRIQPGTFKVYVDGVLAADDIQLGASETVYSDEHQIQVTYQ